MILWAGKLTSSQLEKKKLLIPNSPDEISFSEKKIKPAIIKPVKISIIGVALIITVPIFIPLFNNSSIIEFALLLSSNSF